MYHRETFVYRGADRSGANAGIGYIPVTAAGAIREFTVKVNEEVAGANAVFAVKKNGAIVATLSNTIGIGNQYNTVVEKDVAVAVDDELSFDLVSGYAASPISFALVTEIPSDPIVQNSKSANYTTVLLDAGRHILHPSTDDNPRTFTIDSNANVAYKIGTAITFINRINTVTIAITADTLRLAGAGTTGSRTLAANGIATAIKIGATEWMISGTGLS